MPLKRSKTLEQHIAVFGESGSGKTVMVSSFYGAAQEPEFFRDSLFNVVADDIGQGARLHRNYLGMRDSATAPAATRFAATSYSFTLKLKESGARQSQGASFDALKLVWHDYPGEWFEEAATGAEEETRRVSTFRALMQSDVALLLVDGQRLADHEGEEARYLKSLFTNIRNGLLSLKGDLLEGGRPLVDFPRIWIVALSKADLLPHVDAFVLRDIVVQNAGDELDELRTAIGGMIEGKNLLSVGEDFMVISSAKFKVANIDVAERIGLDLIIPIAGMLPFERHTRWLSAKGIPARVVENLVRNAGPLAAGFAGTVGSKVPGPWGYILRLADPDTMSQILATSADKLQGIAAKATSRGEYLKSIVTQFRIDLIEGEEKRVLLRSRR